MDLRQAWPAIALVASVVPSSEAAASKARFAADLPVESLADRFFRISRMAGFQLIYVNSTIPHLKVAAIRGRIEVEHLIRSSLTATNCSFRLLDGILAIDCAGDNRTVQTPSSRSAIAVPMSPPPQDIVVLGSRLSGAVAAEALPRTLIGADRIAAAAPATADDLFRTIPALGDVTFNAPPPLDSTGYLGSLYNPYGRYFYFDVRASF